MLTWSAMGILGLLVPLILGNWLNEAKKKAVIKAIADAFDDLPEWRRRRLLASREFQEGLEAAYRSYPKTIRSLRQLPLDQASSSDINEVFSCYLEELRKSDEQSTVAEWKANGRQIVQWLRHGPT